MPRTQLTAEEEARITFTRYFTGKGLQVTGYIFYNAEHDKISKCANPTDAYTRSLKHNPATHARPQGVPPSEEATLAYNAEQAGRKAIKQTLPVVAAAGVNENKPLNGVGSQGKSAQGKSPRRASPLGATSSPGPRFALGGLFSNVNMSPSGGGDDGLTTPERRSPSQFFLASINSLSRMVRKIDRNQDEQHRQTLAARDKEEAAREAAAAAAKAAAAAHEAAAAHRSLVEAEIAVNVAARKEKVTAQRAEAKAKAQAAQDKAAAELAALQDSMVKRDGLAGLATPGPERTAE